MLSRGEPVVEMASASGATSPSISPRPEFFDPPRLPSSDTDSLSRRHSIFGRSKSALTGMQWTLNANRQHSNSVTPDEQLTRPASAAGPNRRSNTEPGALHRWRKSFFEKTRRAKDSWNFDGEPEPMLNRPSSSLSMRNSRARTSCAESYKNAPISLPFNFQHISHTGRHQVPRLDTVDEKQLTKDFWAASAYQSPKRHLNGIVADDLDVKQEEAGYPTESPTARPSTSQSARASRNWFKAPSQLEQSNDEGAGDVGEAPPQAEAEDRATTIPSPLPTRQEQSRHPKRQSSLGALADFKNRSRGTTLPNEPLVEAPSTADDPVEPSIAEETEGEQAHPPLDAVNEDGEAFVTRRTHEMQERARQPLPPLPPHATSEASSRNSLVSTKLKTRSQGSSTSASDFARDSRRMTRSMRASQVVSIISESNRPSIASDPSWQDDVDFCYEQAAESTCNFDWDHPPPSERISLSPSIESVGGVRSSKWIALPIAPSDRSSAHLSSAPSDDSMSPRPHPQIRTRQSVGHRGFAAARKDSREKIGANTLTIPENPPSLVPLSPISSIHRSEAPQPSPFTPTNLHFPNFDGSNSDYLSDPDSIRPGGSKHRKSSSYGSYENFSRLSNTHWPSRRSTLAVRNPTLTPPLTSTPELTAGSSDSSRASHNIRSHKRSKSLSNTTTTNTTTNTTSGSTIDKSTISPPIPLAPARPYSSHPPPSAPAPQQEPSHPRPSSSYFLLPAHRPQTPGDRAATPSAPRNLQRSRSATPNNHARSSGSRPGFLLAPLGTAKMKTTTGFEIEGARDSVVAVGGGIQGGLKGREVQRVLGEAGWI